SDAPRRRPSFPTRRSSDLDARRRKSPAHGLLDALDAPAERGQAPSRTLGTGVHRRAALAAERARERAARRRPAEGHAAAIAAKEIGRAHGRTPVTIRPRMP